MGFVGLGVGVVGELVSPVTVGSGDGLSVGSAVGPGLGERLGAALGRPLAALGLGAAVRTGGAVTVGAR